MTKESNKVFEIIHCVQVLNGQRSNWMLEAQQNFEAAGKNNKGRIRPTIWVFYIILNESFYIDHSWLWNSQIAVAILFCSILPAVTLPDQE